MLGLLEVFFSPGKVFDKVRERGTWFPPMLAMVVVSLISGALLSNMVSMNAVVRKQMEANPSTVEKLGPDGIARISSNPAYKYLWYIGALTAPIVLLAMAGIFLGGLSITGGRTDFKRVLGATGYAWWPYSLLVTIMSVLVVSLSADREDLNFKNLVATNVGAFLDPAKTSKMLYSLASSIDLLSFGLILFLGYGLSKVSKSGFGTCTGVVVAVWAVYVLIKAGMAGLF